MSCCLLAVWICASFFFFNDTATTEIYTLSLHDALPILDRRLLPSGLAAGVPVGVGRGHARRRSPHADRARRAASRRLLACDRGGGALSVRLHRSHQLGDRQRGLTAHAGDGGGLEHLHDSPPGRRAIPLPRRGAI